VNVGELFGRYNFLDAFFTLAPPAGVDGHCGNADVDVDISDDTTQYLVKRISHFRVSREESLLGDWSSLASEEAETRVAGDEVQSECANGNRAEAHSLCQSTLPENASVAWVDACADDVCADGLDMANHTLALAAQTEELLVEEDNSATGSCHTCGVGDACFDDAAWAMEVGIPAGFYTNERSVPVIDEQSCFEEVQSALRSWQQSGAFQHLTAGMMDPNIPAPCHDSAGTTYQKYGLTYCR